MDKSRLARVWPIVNWAMENSSARQSQKTAAVAVSGNEHAPRSGEGMSSRHKGNVANEIEPIITQGKVKVGDGPKWGIAILSDP